jgi:hypothetical protein
LFGSRFAEQTTRQTNEESFARDLAGMLAIFNDQSAALVRETSTRVTEVETVARDLSAMLAVFNDQSASLTRESQVRATETSALATDILSLSATVGSMSASVSVLAAAYIVGGVAIATWGFKLDANGKVVGMQAVAASGGSQAQTGEIVFIGANMRSDNYAESSGSPTAGWKLGYDGVLRAVAALLVNCTIKSTLLVGDATAFGTGNGFFAGVDGGVPKLRIGTPGGTRLEWTPADGLKQYGLPTAASATEPALTTPSSNTIRVSKPGGMPSGYTVFYQIGGSADTFAADSFPFDLGMSSGSETLKIWATAPGYTQCIPNLTSYNDLTV